MFLMAVQENKKVPSKQRKNKVVREFREVFDDLLVKKLSDKEISVDDFKELTDLFSPVFNTYKTKTKSKTKVTKEK